MSLTKLEKVSMNKVREWERKLLEYEPNDFQLIYQKYVEKTFSLLPEQVQNRFFSSIDDWLFHLHAIIQSSQLQMEAKERILTAGRIFNNEIETFSDLKKLQINQLQYIAEQQISRHRFYSLAQGGITGTGTALYLGMDIPAIAVINLRVVQLVATTYGYEINTPYEMMTSLKIFHTSLLPRRVKKAGWKELLHELANNREPYFYTGDDKITDITWIEQPLRQLLKMMVIMLFRKKTIQAIPLVSMAYGAASNYHLTRDVTEFAHNYYQLRYLIEKEENRI